MFLLNLSLELILRTEDYIPDLISSLMLEITQWYEQWKLLKLIKTLFYSKNYPTKKGRKRLFCASQVPIFNSLKKQSNVELSTPPPTCLNATTEIQGAFSATKKIQNSN